MIEYTKDVCHGKFRIWLKADNNSYGSPKDFLVILGIGHSETLLFICDRYIQTHSIDCNIDKKYFDFLIYDDLDVDTWDIEEESLDNIALFNSKIIEENSILAINAIAFALYHEFGHVKYDDFGKSPIEKEKRADLFAYEAVREKQSHHPMIENEKSPFFIGALLELVLILKVCDPLLTEVDASHPHPIERLYYLLEYFHIQEDSFLWEYVYDETVEWANDNHIAMTFVKDYSILAKDKFLDFYHRYKK